MKIKILLRRIIIESVVFISLLAVFGGIYLGVSSYATKIEEDKTQKQNALAQLNAKILKAEDEGKKASGNIDLFNKLSEEKYGESAIKSDILLEALEQNKDVYSITGLKVKIKQPVELQAPEFKRNMLSMVFSQVDIEMSSYSDESIFKFLDAVKAKFPGLLIMGTAEILKKSQASVDNIRQISMDNEIAMVDGKFSLYLLAFKFAPDPAIPAPGGT